MAEQLELQQWKWQQPYTGSHALGSLPAHAPARLRAAQVLDVLQLSRATLRKIQQNMW